MWLRFTTERGYRHELEQGCYFPYNTVCYYLNAYKYSYDFCLCFDYIDFEF